VNETGSLGRRVGIPAGVREGLGAVRGNAASQDIDARPSPPLVAVSESRPASDEGALRSPRTTLRARHSARVRASVIDEASNGDFPCCAF